jgi:hypothetical protein
VLAGFAAMTITFLSIALSGHIGIFMQACEFSNAARPACSPLSPWVWAVPYAGIVGAGAGAVGAFHFMRHLVRPRAPTIFD